MKVVGFGTVAMDVLMQTAELPQEDGFAVIERSTYLPGGSGTNVISQVSRLGAKCGFVAQIGDDTIGQQIRQSLRNESIDDRGLKVLPGGSSLHTKILVDAKGKKFILLDMGTAFLSLERDDEDIAYCLQGDILYTDLLPGTATIAAVKAAKAAGRKTVFNMQVGLGMMESMGVSKEMILDTLQYLDVFAPCRDGLFALAGTTDLDEAKNYIRRYFKGVLLITLGSEGSLAYDENNAVVMNSSKCIGCKLCMNACPLGNIGVNTEKKQMHKCDLCGGDPKCVKFCPSGALVFEDPADSQDRRKAVAAAFKDVFGEEEV